MELEEAKKALNKYREELWKDNKGVEEYAESGEDLEKIDAIDTVISELVALQNLLDEKNEEIDHLQKENGKLTRARKWFIEHTIGQIATPEMLRKILADEYIHKDKIREKIEELKQDFLEYTEEFQGKCDDTDEYYFYDTQNMQNKINLLENLLKEE